VPLSTVGGTPALQSAALTPSIRYSAGDLSPNTSYMVLKDGQPLLPVSSDSSGRVSFTDVPGTTSTVEYAVVPNDQPPPKPTVTVAATDANASESGPDSGTFTISRTGSTGSALTVNYTLSGTAQNGSDYQQLATSVTIAAGASSATVTVTPIDDSQVEGNETVVLTLAANSAYTAGSPSSATVTIADNDQPPLPTVTVVANDANASEQGLNTGSFTVSRAANTSTALTVNYTLSGTAQN